ncbi:hypothetical protein [Methylomonas methanica]|uniref:Uncharacterized protein n=1 Tax=Methylomonas methanica (strain DSM 25384 / MC09) TaxID=857087 RepID=G0A1P8_METMM|nr:hypothetical protein [Methylomonas methanica]AEG00109.1 hypothetical protein Metme_1691 [Methylomonas methanica MC09]
MNTRSLSSASLNILQIFLQVNFNASVILILLASVLSLTGSEFFFENTSDLYGPLANNLRLVLIYLCLVQIAVYGFYQMSSNYAAIVALGAFLLILILSLEYYSAVNQVEIDENYQQVFLYAGLSHLLYGGICVFRKKAVN